MTLVAESPSFLQREPPRMSSNRPKEKQLSHRRKQTIKTGEQCPLSQPNLIGPLGPPSSPALCYPPSVSVPVPPKLNPASRSQIHKPPPRPRFTATGTNWEEPHGTALHFRDKQLRAANPST